MKVTVLGYDFNEGISKKTGKPYAIGKLFAGCKIDGQNAKGMMGTEYQVSPDILRSLSELPLPFDAELNIEDVMRYGIRESKVLGVTPLASPLVQVKPHK